MVIFRFFAGRYHKNLHIPVTVLSIHGDPFIKWQLIFLTALHFHPKPVKISLASLRELQKGIPFATLGRMLFLVILLPD